MRTKPRWIVLGILLAVVAGISGAQDAEPQKDPPEDAPKPAAIEDDTSKTELERLPPTEPTEQRRAGRFYAEGSVWFVTPTGLEYTPAIAYTDPTQALVLDLPFKSETPPRWRLAWELPNDLGEIIGTYASYSQEQSLTLTAPGQYIYGEIQAFPLFAGVFDDGLADGFATQAKTLLREIRFDFAHRAFETPRVRGKWFAGIRRVQQNWDLATQYYSLVQPPELFPPILPPRADLQPFPDLSRAVSTYEGRGAEAGLDVTIAFDRAGKIAFEAGLAVAAVRGTLSSESFSQTHYYVLNFEGEQFILGSPFDIFDQFLENPAGGEPIPAISLITQVHPTIALRGDHVPNSSFAVDVYLGFRWKVWRDLDVFAGFRDQHYDGAGEVVRPTQATVLPNGAINVQSLSRTPISTTYEGFYLGVGYRF